MSNATRISPNSSGLFTGASLGLFGDVCKQILNSLSEVHNRAVDRSRFAALPPRYLEDVGLTEAERVSALALEETMIDPWRVVASHL